MLCKGIWRLLLLSWTFGVVVAHDGAVSEETLRRIFPEAENFATRQKTLLPRQIAKLEEATGETVLEQDRLLVFYVAVGKNETGRYHSIGAALVLHAQGPGGLIDMVVGYNLDLSVRKVIVEANASDPSIESAAFLSQLEQKGPSDPLILGEDISFNGNREAATVLMRQVKRGMRLVDLLLKG